MSEPLTRREMLKQLGVMLGVAAGFPVSVGAQVRTQALSAVGNTFISLSPAEAETLRAMVARIIPADENGPGALEARADRYIYRALSGALRNQRPAYATGLAEVDARAQSLNGAAFAKLSAADQDAVLTDMQSGQFFNLVRAHTIQGTFSDPFYGGNENFIGWDLIGSPAPRVTVKANLQRMDVKPEPSRKSAYDYPMFNKGEI